MKRLNNRRGLIAWIKATSYVECKCQVNIVWRESRHTFCCDTFEPDKIVARIDGCEVPWSSIATGTLAYIVREMRRQMYNPAYLQYKKEMAEFDWDAYLLTSQIPF